MISLMLMWAMIGQQSCGPGGCMVAGRPSVSVVERVPTSRVVGPLVRPAIALTGDDPGYGLVVVRIENRRPDAVSFGSGVILTETGLVLTCKHIFRGGVGQLVVRRGDGRAWGASLVGVDPVDDLGAVFIGPVAGIPRVRYLREQPRQAVIVGYPGRSLQVRALMGQYIETANVFYNVSSPLGVSGGPCFQPGTLALGGVQWGADGVSSAVTPITAVREFLARVGRAFFGQRRPQTVNNVTQISGGGIVPVSAFTAFEPEFVRQPSGASDRSNAI